MYYYCGIQFQLECSLDPYGTMSRSMVASCARAALSCREALIGQDVHSPDMLLTYLV